MKPIDTFKILPGNHLARSLNSIEIYVFLIFHVTADNISPIVFDSMIHIFIFLACYRNFLIFPPSYHQQFAHHFSSFCHWVLNVFSVFAQFRDQGPHILGFCYDSTPLLGINFYISFYCITSHSKTQLLKTIIIFLTAPDSEGWHFDWTQLQSPSVGFRWSTYALLIRWLSTASLTYLAVSQLSYECRQYVIIQQANSGLIPWQWLQSSQKQQGRKPQCTTTFQVSVCVIISTIPLSSWSSSDSRDRRTDFTSSWQ